MERHRLPGMSVSGEEWAALAARAEALGITRTELIRLSIARAVREDLEPELLVIRQLQTELARYRHQLARVRATVNNLTKDEPLPGHDPLAAA